MNENEREKEERLSTEDLAVATRQAPDDQRDMPMPDQAENSHRPVLSRTGGETNGHAEARPMALLPEDEVNAFQFRWNAIQTAFVDEPRSAVEDADGLVAEIMKHLAEIFAEERAQLEDQWTRGDDVSTEHLRVTLQRYRSFFHRLLSL